MSYFSVRSAVNSAEDSGVVSPKAADAIIEAGGEEIYVEEHNLVSELIEKADAGKVKMSDDVRDRLNGAFMLRGGALVSNKSAWQTFVNHLSAPMVVGGLFALFSKERSSITTALGLGLGGIAAAALSPLTLLTGSFFGAKRLFED